MQIQRINSLPISANYGYAQTNASNTNFNKIDNQQSFQGRVRALNGFYHDLRAVGVNAFSRTRISAILYNCESKASKHKFYVDVSSELLDDGNLARVEIQVRNQPKPKSWLGKAVNNLLRAIRIIKDEEYIETSGSLYYYKKPWWQYVGTHSAEEFKVTLNSTIESLLGQL